MKSINLIFGCHSHQPVGNFDFVFEEAYQKSYLPFVEVLERYPAVHVTLHYTGPLWDWFLAHQPEFITRLNALVQSGQVEIMGGAYYEPLLCAIPERDAIEQIRRMQGFCQEHFGQKPRGMWLTERVWEPQMARILAKAGVEYTALDDSHFLCSGLRAEELFGCYMTEDEGLPVKVFPILEKLRYTIPFHQVHESIDFLREHATEDGLRCAVIHDDGEKFGVWPGTYHSVYEEGWLEEFFQALTENQDWIHSLTYQEYLKKAAPIGRTYITCASYFEMMEWALPTPMQRQLHAAKEEIKLDPEQHERIAPFLRGGFWRSFLAKYAESNNMQKRMLRLSNRIEALREDHAETPAFIEAETLLYKGQCNCSYWHGAFGGLYLNHLRTAIYEQLIAADAVLDRLEGVNAGDIHCVTEDFDADGHDEAILDTHALTVFCKPNDGGTIFELDYKPKPFNFFNTLTRRDEPYHDALREGNVQVGDMAEGGGSIHELVKAKEADLDTFLVYDPYRRASLRDHFYPLDVSVDQLWANQAGERGDFAQGHYAMAWDDTTLHLSRSGKVEQNGPQPLQVKKSILPVPDIGALEIQYDIQYEGSESLQVLFSVDFGVNFLTGSAVDRYYHSDDLELNRAQLATRGDDSNLKHIALVDGWQQLEWGLRSEQPMRVFRFPLETVSQSEGGQERVYQGSVIVPTWELNLAPGSTFQCALRMEVRELNA